MVALRLQVLDFVHEYIGRWGDSPSLGEIAVAVGVDRKQAHKAVLSLAQSGLLIKAPGPRGLMLPSERQTAIRVLQRLGWRVDDACLAATNRPLMEGPAIDYTPPPARKRQVADHGGIRDDYRRIAGGWGT